MELPSIHFTILSRHGKKGEKKILLFDKWRNLIIPHKRFLFHGSILK